VIEPLVLVFGIVGTSVLAFVLSNFFFGILKGVADEWNDTFYTVVVNGKVYEHCRQVTPKRGSISFHKDGKDYEFYGCEFSTVKEKENG